mgnify:CR=1 FL=1
MNPALAAVETILLLLHVYLGALTMIYGLRRLPLRPPLSTVGWNQ